VISEGTHDLALPVPLPLENVFARIFADGVAGLVILVELINDEVGMTVADVEVSTVDAPRGGHHPTVDDLLVADAARIPCRLEGAPCLRLRLRLPDAVAAAAGTNRLVTGSGGDSYESSSSLL